MVKFFKGNKVIIVIKRETPEDAINNAQMLIDQGIRNIEITFNTPNAPEVIKHLRITNKGNDILVGAGTVTNKEQAIAACKANADFIVSPGFGQDVSDVCHQYNMLYIPGVITPTEITLAMNNGWNFVKLFPSSFVGIDYVKALKAPFPKLEFMPTAGINKNNIQDWFDVGASAVGGSGKLLTDNLEQIKTELADLFQNLKEG